MTLANFTHIYEEPLTFYPADADPVPVEMRQVRVVTRDGLPVDCVITFQVEPEVYSHIDANLLFHLTLEARNPTSEQFEMRPLEIEARLDPQKIRLLSGVHNAREAAESLHQLTADDALRDPESWYALYVKQDIALPPELEEEGSLKAGFSTTWVKTLETSPHVTSPLFETMMQFFEAEDWSYERAEDDTMLTVGYTNGEYRWKCVAQARDDADLALFYSICPFNIPSSKRAAIMEFITRANFDLPMGNFELNLDSGEVRFKTSMRFSETAFTPDHMNDLVALNVGTMEQYLPGIRALLSTDVSVAEALAAVE